MPVEIRGDRLAAVGVVALEGFDAGFGEEGEDLDASIDESSEGVGFAGAGRPHEGDVEALCGVGEAGEVAEGLESGSWGVHGKNLLKWEWWAWKS